MVVRKNIIRSRWSLQQILCMGHLNSMLGKLSIIMGGEVLLNKYKEKFEILQDIGII